MKKIFGVVLTTLVVLVLVLVSALPVGATTPPAVLFEDNFERGWTEVNGTWSIVNDGTGNHVYEQSLPQYIPGVRSVGNTSWTDYTVQAKVKVTGTTWGRWGGILMRATAPDTYYELYLQENGNLQLVRTVAGSRVGLVNPFVGTFYDQWWYVKGQVSGNNIKGKAWKVGDPEPVSWIIDYTDASAIANGKVGLITFSNVANQPVFFDDVIVKDLSMNTLFSDDFELNWQEIAGTWSLVNDGTGNHVYYQSSAIDNSFAWAPTMIAGSTDWTDYSFEVWVKALYAPTVWGLGPAYRVQSGPSFGQYVVQILEPDASRLRVYVGNGSSPPGPWTKIAEATPLLTISTNQWYKIVVTVDGDQHKVDVYNIGGGLAATVSFTDSAYMKGAIGLNAASYAQFDNVKVTALYGFIGLLSPYQAPPKAFKVGSSIPLKWQYSFLGNVVDSSAANPTVEIRLVTGDGTIVEGIPITVEDSGVSCLRYDSLTMTWQFNWQTKGLSPGLYYIRIISGQTGQIDGPFQIQLR